MKRKYKKHTGNILKFEIKDKGYSKKTIASKLEMSYNTLTQRLEDGEFSLNQYNTLLKNRYIPEQKQPVH